jgi:hypothetical protein
MRLGWLAPHKTRTLMCEFVTTRNNSNSSVTGHWSAAALPLEPPSDGLSGCPGATHCALAFGFTAQYKKQVQLTAKTVSSKIQTALV